MRGRFSILWLVALLVLGLPLQALAQDEGESAEGESMEGKPMDDADAEDAEAEFGEVIVVTGTRAQPRSLVESIVPIDVLSGDDFANQGDTDVAALLRNVAPPRANRTPI